MSHLMIASSATARTTSTTQTIGRSTAI